MGLDGSSDMLAHCRRRLEREGLTAELVLGDMRDFDLGRKFALVTQFPSALSSISLMWTIR